MCREVPVPKAAELFLPSHLSHFEWLSEQFELRETLSQSVLSHLPCDTNNNTDFLKVLSKMEGNSQDACYRI